MTDEHIETILSDFRGWLREHGDKPMEAETKLNLVNEFTALRHEVKLLTKATRGQSEQMAATLETLAEREPETIDDDADSSDELRPVLTSILDITDTLERAVSAVQRLADESLPKQSLIRRLLTGPPSTDTKDKLAALADGLELSQQRLLAAFDGLILKPWTPSASRSIRKRWKPLKRLPMMSNRPAPCWKKSARATVGAAGCSDTLK